MHFKKLAINEIFVSTQGEGPETGRLSLFIRFQGCSLKCPFCDTPLGLSKTANKERKYTPRKLAEKASSILLDPQYSGGIGHVVLTGGEPLEQPQESLLEFLTLLQDMMREHDRPSIGIETNGLYPLRVDLPLDTVVISPKLRVAEWKELTPKLIASITETRRRLLVSHQSGRRQELHLKFPIWMPYLPQAIESMTQVADFLHDLRKESEKRGNMMSSIWSVILTPENPNRGPASMTSYGMLVDAYQKFLDPDSYERQKQSHWVAEFQHHTVRILPQLHRLAGIK